MAGSLNSPSTVWTVGETGPTLPDTGPVVASGAPSGEPDYSPMYVDNVNDDLYVWAEDAWKGPYNLGS